MCLFLFISAGIITALYAVVPTELLSVFGQKVILSKLDWK